MKVVHETGFGKSMPIVHAIASGFGGVVRDRDFILRHFDEIEELFIYGFLRGGSELIKRCREAGKTFYYIDHGYFGRTIGYRRLDRSYFRITKNRMQPIDYQTGFQQDRFRSFNIPLKQWRKNDGPVLFVPPSENVKFYFRESKSWMTSELDAIAEKKLSITIREKKQKGIPVKWAFPKLLVTYNSAIFIEALCEGVPVKTSAECAGFPVSSSYDDLNFFDRMDFFSWLSYQQFNVHEFKSGKAKQILSEQESRVSDRLVYQG